MIKKGAIRENIIDSQDVGFLNCKEINLGSIKERLIAADGMDDNLSGQALANIEDVIGAQEAEWITRNDPKDLADYVVHRYKFKFYPRMRKLEPFPLHLLIEPTSVCNMRCVMCFQKDPCFRTKPYRGFIDFGFFRELIDQAVENNCRAVTLASRGEPTLHKDFGRMLRYCEGKFLELKINTNALTLSEDLCYDILDSGCDIVVFSIDSSEEKEYQDIRPGGRFKTVAQNIRRFAQIKKSDKRYAKTSSRVSGVYLGSQSKEAFLDFWKDLADSVTFAGSVFRWDSYGNKAINHTTPCNLLWERMYVWFDGTCNPCDFDYKSVLRLGNAREMPLGSIWTGEKYGKYRQAHLNEERQSLFPCDRCNMF